MYQSVLKYIVEDLKVNIQQVLLFFSLENASSL